MTAQLTERGRESERAMREKEINARLLNWGAWAASSARVGGSDEHAFEVFELDAQVVEVALCRMKRTRSDLWDYVERCYLRRWMAETIARDLRISMSVLYARRRQVFVWLDGYWERDGQYLDTAQKIG